MMSVSSKTGGTTLLPQPASTATFSGKIHGGSQPVTGSTVNLYAAGSGGYGSQATLLATTQSNGGGGYTFINGIPGNGGTNTYVCPTITTAGTGAQVSPLIYIVSIGGVTDGSGDPTHANSAAVLMAAAGPCNTLTSATGVYINELTTVAATSALGQYINPGTTAGTFSIGSPNTTQGLQGLNNAFLQMGNLVSTAGGGNGNSGQITSRNYTGSQDITRSTVVGVTVTATPESTKLNTVADIIAACVNNVSNTGAGCAMLFSAATPAAPGLTSHPTITPPAAAVDTVQAAYFMATNPAQTAMNAAGTSTVAPPTTCNGTVAAGESPIACELTLVTGQSPFQPTLSAAPTDWSIGVTFSSAGQCNAMGDTTLTSTGYFFNGVDEEAVDKFGNVWMANGNRYAQGSIAAPYVPATISAISPYGQPLACPMTSVTSGGTGTAIAQGARGVTVDPSGNIWGSFQTFASTGLQEFTPTAFTDANGVPGITGVAGAVPAPVLPSAVPGASAPYILASDLSGNIFYASPNTVTSGGAQTAGFALGSGENLFELPVGGTQWVQVASNTGQVYGTTSTATPPVNTASGVNNPLQMVPDSKGRIWVAESANVTGPVAYYPTGSTTYGYYQTPYPSNFTTFPADYGLAISNAIPVAGFTNGAPATAADVVFSGTTCCGSVNKTTAGYSGRNELKATPTVTAAGSAPSYTEIQGLGQAGYANGNSSAGQNGVRALTVDGAGTSYIGSEFATLGTFSTVVGGPGDAAGNFGITLYNAALQPIGNPGVAPATSAVCTTSGGCPTGGGYVKADFNGGRALIVDNSGTLWVGNGYYASLGGSNTVYNGVTVTQVVGLGVPVGTPLSTMAAAGTINVAP